MKKLLSILFCILFLQLAEAQDKSWNHWYFGFGLGIDFTDGQRKLDDKFNTVNGNYAIASISHPETGEYLFMTNGLQCFDKNFNLMPTTFGHNTPVFSFIIPKPGSEFEYYVFVANNAHEIYYVTVDMRLNNGLGDISVDRKRLRMNADHHFTFVKRYFDEGYWLISHTMGLNEFQVFPITVSGVSHQPVVSQVGQSTPNNNKFVYGNLISNKTGTELIHSFGKQGGKAVVQHLTFDKKCGLVNFKKDYYAPVTQGVEHIAHSAFSENDEYLYIAWYGFGGGIGIYQYHMDDNSSEPLKKLSFTDDERYFHRLALAPDGLIYVTSGENGAVTSKVGVIHKANTSDAYYNFNEVELATQSHYKYVENWPPFVMDWSAFGDKPESPQFLVQAKCLTDSVSFAVGGPFENDSFYWDLGDGSQSKKWSFNHKYQNPGNYTVRFVWNLCGQTHQKEYDLSLGAPPVFDFGADTTLCAGATLNLVGPSTADNFLWNDGSTTAYKNVDLHGTYVLKAGVGNCFASDTIDIAVRPPVLVDLGVEQFICEELEELVKIDAGKGHHYYKWTPTGDTTQWIWVKEVGDYFVVVKDFYGCAGEDGTQVERRCPLQFEMPTAFSPNNDGLNDLFRPVFADVVDFRLIIYNRWGELVFETDDPQKGWNGYYKNLPASQGIYLYQVQFSGYLNNRLQKINKSGTVHLVR